MHEAYAYDRQHLQAWRKGRQNSTSQINHLHESAIGASWQVGDAYAVLLREKKLPMQLLADPEQPAREGGRAKRSHMLATQPFGTTFGKQQQRKKPKLARESYGDLLEAAAQQDNRFCPAASMPCFLH